MKPLVAPSLLAADFSRLGEEIRAVEKAGADALHWDIMDGRFVPALSFGPPVVQKLRPLTKLPFDVHLMVSRPENFIEDFAAAGADSLTFHIESSESRPLELIQKIQSRGMKAGLSLKPATPLEAIVPFLPHLDLILVMTVEPGRGGQDFIESEAKKVKELARRRHKLQSCSSLSRSLLSRSPLSRNPLSRSPQRTRLNFQRSSEGRSLSPLIAADGGVTPSSAKQLKGAADLLVAGTCIFHSKNYAETIASLKRAAAS